MPAPIASTAPKSATMAARFCASASTAVPDKGKANAAVIALLAKALGVPKSAITLVSGDTARQKTVRVAGAADAIVAALEGL